MRRIIISMLLFLPMVASADDASLLGPQTTIGPSSASSTDTSNSLQPNGTSTLQNGGGSSLGGSQSDAQATLQQPATSDQAKLFIQGETDGSSAPTSDGLPWYTNLLGLMVAVMAFAAGLWWWQRRRAPQFVKSSNLLKQANSKSSDFPLSSNPVDSTIETETLTPSQAKKSHKTNPKKRRKSKRR